MNFRKGRILPILIAGLIAQACGNPPSPNGGTTKGTCTNLDFAGQPLPNVGAWSAGHNVMNITVNDSTLPFGAVGNAYLNEPTVSVTVCAPNNPSQCQTIDHILLDTGSFGLRIFKSALTVPLNPVTNGNGTLAECVQYGDGSTEWGPVEYAYVQLASEPKVGVPVMVIQSDYLNPPDVCTHNADTSPTEDGYNGILGVGVFAQDCGDTCVSDSTNGVYFTCQNNNCSCGATADLMAQVTNPISKIPTDGNGLVMKLPSVAAGGVVTVTGNYLFLGIDTQGAGGNNSSSGKTAYVLDGSGQFLSEFDPYSNNQIASFIDSGSSVLFFPPPLSAPFLPDCGSTNPGFAGLYCPTGTPVPFHANNFDANGNHSNLVNFSIENAVLLIENSNVASTVGATSLGGGDPTFDWGLPFFFGKNVFVGFENQSSSIGTGPYWAY